MDALTQIKYRLEILDAMISIYSHMPHNNFLPNEYFEDIIFVLSEWKCETELLLKNLSN